MWAGASDGLAGARDGGYGARSEWERTVGPEVEDERDAVAVDGAAESERLIDESRGDLGGVGRGLEVGAEQLGLRGDECSAGDLEGGFEERERGELRGETELRRRVGVKAAAEAGLADVQPCGSRSDGPSMRTVWHWWRRRESSASTRALLPRKLCHSSYSRLVVMMVERRR